MPFHEGPDRISEVAQQVPAIRYLDCTGRALPDPVRVSARPVSGHDLHARVLAQPRRQGLRLAVGQQVDAIAL
ncbi:hypothetical protein ROTAS13_04471 [Roseomonas sp. TAS13]|nr:hypothetical protein ROTAS13_04471 [Roseomonas sp. TAS13]